MRSNRGFMLLEIMLAMAIFGMVIIALARCLGETADAMRRSNRESQIRLGMESRIAEVRMHRPALGIQKEKTDANGVDWEEEWRPLPLVNREKTALGDLYRYSVRAHWTDRNADQSDEAAVTLYLPGA